MLFSVEVDRKMRLCETMAICASTMAAQTGKMDNLTSLIDEYIGLVVPEEKGRRESFVQQAAAQMRRVAGKVFRITPKGAGALAKVVDESEALASIEEKKRKYREAVERRRNILEQQAQQRLRGY